MALSIFTALAFVLVPMGFTVVFQLIFVQLGWLSVDLSLWGSFDFFLTVLIQAGIFLFFAVLFQQKLGAPFFGWEGSFTFRELLIAFAGLFTVNLVSGMIMQGLDVEVEQFQGVNKENLKAAPFWFIVSVSGIAPIYEEIIFRGFLLRLLLEGIKNPFQKKKPGSLAALPEAETENPAEQASQQEGQNPAPAASRSKQIIAVVLTSVLFAVVHMDMDAAFPIFLLSVYFCLWTLYKRSIYLAIVIHSMQNFLASLAFLYVKLPAPL